jgi:hypothetical protein
VGTLALLASFFASGSAGAQERRWGPVSDGSYWLQLTEGPKPWGEIAKQMLVLGIKEGMLFGESPLRQEYGPAAPVGQVVRALDQFYADALNEQVPVFFALHVVAAELRGTTRDSIDALVRSYRERGARARAAVSQ